MPANSRVEISEFLLLLIVLTLTLRWYIAGILKSEAVPGAMVLLLMERLISRLAGNDPARQMTAATRLAFTGLAVMTALARGIVNRENTKLTRQEQGRKK